MTVSEEEAMFRDTRVINMEVNLNGKVGAVVTPTGSFETEEMEVILAAGPWIMPLLDASSVQQPPVSRAPVATGIFAFRLELTTEQWEKYSGLPRLSQIGVGTYHSYTGVSR